MEFKLKDDKEKVVNEVIEKLQEAGFIIGPQIPISFDENDIMEMGHASVRKVLVGRIDLTMLLPDEFIENSSYKKENK